MTDVEMAEGKSRVIAAAEAISGDLDKAVAWLQEPIATFGGKTALELVAEVTCPQQPYQ